MNSISIQVRDLKVGSVCLQFARLIRFGSLRNSYRVDRSVKACRVRQSGVPRKACQVRQSGVPRKACRVRQSGVPRMMYRGLQELRF